MFNGCRTNLLFCWLLVLSLSACQPANLQSQPAPAKFSYKHSKQKPAVISNASQSTRNELAEVVARALHQTRVILAEDALTATDRLVIARKVRGDLENDPVMGRTDESALTFNLVKIEQSCYLVNQLKQQLYRLKTIKCRLLNP